MRGDVGAGFIVTLHETQINIVGSVPTGDILVKEEQDAFLAC